MSYMGQDPGDLSPDDLRRDEPSELQPEIASEWPEKPLSNNDLDTPWIVGVSTLDGLESDYRAEHVTRLITDMERDIEKGREIL